MLSLREQLHLGSRTRRHRLAAVLAATQEHSGDDAAGLYVHVLHTLAMSGLHSSPAPRVTVTARKHVAHRSSPVLYVIIMNSSHLA